MSSIHKLIDPEVLGQHLSWVHDSFLGGPIYALAFVSGCLGSGEMQDHYLETVMVLVVG